MSNTEEIGVAFLGFGRMGETHLRNLAAIAGVRVVVVADQRNDRAELGKAMSGAELATKDQADAINHPSVHAVVTILKFKNGVLGVVETSRRSNWGYDIRTEVAGAKGKVVKY